VSYGMTNLRADTPVREIWTRLYRVCCAASRYSSHMGFESGWNTKY